MEYKEFTSVQQVYDYLDSIYEPENRHVKKDNPSKDSKEDKQDKEKKDNPNSNKDKDKPKKGN